MNDNGLGPDTLYPMRVVTRLTGLSSHTIRIWERRYQAVTPLRTEGNSRRYSAKDVRRLILLREATRLGYKIMDLAAMDDEALAALQAHETEGLPPAEISAPMAGVDGFRTEYLSAIRRFDARSASEQLSRAAMLLEPSRFVFDVVLPLLRETGLLWERREMSVAHEHLVSFQVRSLLDTLMRFGFTQSGAPRLLVATPEGYHHEFGALAGALLAAARGLEPIYLGASIPTPDLVDALTASRIDLLLLGVLFNPGRGKELARLNSDLARLSGVAEVWVGLPSDHPASGAIGGVRYFDSFEELDLALTQRFSRANGAARR
ncbi:MAG: MerR family transcriptional regulator [Polyangia bacterium]|jgi:DNA-binding transcriptional MerR regulator|nr:MerR family transcriptional regulator [Polyangia bacterium]